MTKCKSKFCTWLCCSCCCCRCCYEDEKDKGLLITPDEKEFFEVKVHKDGQKEVQEVVVRSHQVSGQVTQITGSDAEVTNKTKATSGAVLRPDGARLSWKLIPSDYSSESVLPALHTDNVTWTGTGSSGDVDNKEVVLTEEVVELQLVADETGEKGTVSIAINVPRH